MSIHWLRKSASWLIRTDGSIIGDNGTNKPKEVASPINNQIVASTCAKYISTATKPSYLVGAILICFNIAICVTIRAIDVKEIGISSGIKG